MYRRQVFTLIELMIVVAIVAILAAIAIPNLLESRIQANEANAVGNLKTYATGQYTYQKANYSALNGGASKSYCADFTNMGGAAAHTNGASVALSLISPNFAQANAPATGLQGYYYQNDDGTNVTNWGSSFGLWSFPVSYGQSGNNSYCILTDSTIYMKDQGGTLNIDANPAADATWNNL